MRLETSNFDDAPPSTKATTNETSMRIPRPSSPRTSDDHNYETKRERERERERERQKNSVPLEGRAVGDKKSRPPHRHRGPQVGTAATNLGVPTPLNTEQEKQAVARPRGRPWQRRKKVLPSLFPHSGLRQADVTHYGALFLSTTSRKTIGKLDKTQ